MSQIKAPIIPDLQLWVDHINDHLPGHFREIGLSEDLEQAIDSGINVPALYIVPHSDGVDTSAAGKLRGRAEFLISLVYRIKTYGRGGVDLCRQIRQPVNDLLIGWHPGAGENYIYRLGGQRLKPRDGDYFFEEVYGLNAHGA